MRTEFIHRNAARLIAAAIMLLAFIAASGTVYGEAETWTDESTGIVWSYYPGDMLMVSSCKNIPSDGVVTVPAEIDGTPVKRIGAKGFQNRDDIVELYLPDSVDLLFQETFYKCSGLKKIRLPEGITELPSDLFRECSALEEIEIPEGVTLIRNRAFYMCKSLKHITISKNVTSFNLYDSPFVGCSSLESIEVAPGNTAFASQDGVLFNADMTELIRYPEGKTDASYTVPASVKKFAYEAFRNAQLSTCNLPDGLTEITSGAFYHAENLTGITIPEGVTKIGSSAFYYARGVKTVHLPSTLTFIGDHAFYLKSLLAQCGC